MAVGDATFWLTRSAPSLSTNAACAAFGPEHHPRGRVSRGCEAIGRRIRRRLVRLHSCRGQRLGQPLRTRRKTACSTNIDNSGAVTMLASMRAAMRWVTSEPVPPPNIFGTSLATITIAVIAYGHKRVIVPLRIPFRKPSSLPRPGAGRADQARFGYSNLITPNSFATFASAMKPIAPAALRL